MKQLIMCITVLAMSACSKKTSAIDPASIDSFYFGSSYGHCINNCATFFSISNQQLFPDTITRYSGTVGFSATPLPDVKYQLANELLRSFPTYLLQHPNETFGCPDCADQGAIRIGLTQQGVLKTWHIDTDVSKQPKEIKEYISKLRSILDQL